MKLLLCLLCFFVFGFIGRISCAEKVEIILYGESSSVEKIAYDVAKDERTGPYEIDYSLGSLSSPIIFFSSLPQHSWLTRLLL